MLVFSITIAKVSSGILNILELYRDAFLKWKDLAIEKNIYCIYLCAVKFICDVSVMLLFKILRGTRGKKFFVS